MYKIHVSFKLFVWSRISKSQYILYIHSPHLHCMIFFLSIINILNFGIFTELKNFMHISRNKLKVKSHSWSFKIRIHYSCNLVSRTLWILLAVNWWIVKNLNPSEIFDTLYATQAKCQQSGVGQLLPTKKLIRENH